MINWAQPPTQQADQMAAMLRIKDYQRILVGPDTPVEMQRCLCQEKLPILIAVAVYDTIYGKQVSYDGTINLPAPGDTLLGAHAMFVDAFDGTTQRFQGWNSWGNAWGWGGRFSIPFEWFTRPDLTYDVWSFSALYW
jgi:aminopeptidase C